MRVMKRAMRLLPLALLALAAFAQTVKQPKPLTNDDAATSPQDATDFVRDLRGARTQQFAPLMAWQRIHFL